MLTFSIGDSADVISCAKQAGATAIALSFTIAAVGAGTALFKRQPAPFAIGVTIAVSIFLYVKHVSCVSSLDDFVSVDASSQQVRLTLADPERTPIWIQRDEISDLRYGVPYRSSRLCYLRVELRTGDSYQSATISGISCKAYRDRLASLLNVQ